jgi:hypothetical protein
MISIVGGTYNEYCFEPFWDEVFGSGLRACAVISAIDPSYRIKLHTFLDQESNQYLTSFKQLHSSFDFEQNVIETTATFSYDHPLSVPRIFPRLDSIDRSKNHIYVKGDLILYFGLLEGTASVIGKKVVYDPQSPVTPIAFSATNSKADSLAIVINLHEAQKLSGSKNITDIKTFLIDKEKAEVCIIKMGPHGALVCAPGKDDIAIPVYQTPSVWPIGSGDTFAAAFAFHWFRGAEPVNAAERASYATAEYSNTKGYHFSELDSNLTLKKTINRSSPMHQVYLAGPFFNFSERWILDQLRTALMDMNLKVFSPYHDVGHGSAKDVVHKDIEGLKDSKLVVAFLDGLDSGTLFEIGYAIANNIPIIGITEKETQEDLKMLEGTGCYLVNDLTTAVYKAYWILSEIN